MSKNDLGRVEKPTKKFSGESDYSAGDGQKELVEGYKPKNGGKPVGEINRIKDELAHVPGQKSSQAGPEAKNFDWEPIKREDVLTVAGVDVQVSSFNMDGTVMFERADKRKDHAVPVNVPQPRILKDCFPELIEQLGIPEEVINRGFKKGDIVNIEKSNGEIEEGWTINLFNPNNGRAVCLDKNKTFTTGHHPQTEVAVLKLLELNKETGPLKNENDGFWTKMKRAFSK